MTLSNSTLTETLNLTSQHISYNNNNNNNNNKLGKRPPFCMAKTVTYKDRAAQFQ